MTQPAPHGEDASLVGRSVGRYRVVQLLGRGGMGAVYAAEDPSLGRRVALKVLEGALVAEGERRARFFREARGAAAATHENIAAVYEVGEEDGRVFLAMELVEGRTLRDVVAEHPAGLPIAEVLRVGWALARGLAKAHEAGVVHRDLKPENVMIGEEGRVKILDFGIAKLRGEREEGARDRFATQEGRILGTPHYMSPEQASGRPVDERSDLFSLGVLLFEMATGQRPFEGDTTMLILVSVARDEPPLPSALRPDLPLELEGLIARCLCKDPALRPASARAVGEELRRCGEGAPPGPAASERASGPRMDGESLSNAPTLLELPPTLEAIAPGTATPAAPFPSSAPPGSALRRAGPADASDHATLASGAPASDGSRARQQGPSGHASDEPASGGPNAGKVDISALPSAPAQRDRRRQKLALGAVLALVLLGIWAVLEPSTAPLPTRGGTSEIASAPSTVPSSPAPPKLRFRRLTSNPADVRIGLPSLSPDGQSFVYVVGSRVYRQSFADGTRHSVPIDGITSVGDVACLPDGALLVSGLDPQGKPGLWRWSGAGLAPVRLREEAPPLRLSHDGALLVRGRGQKLYVDSLDGRERRLVHSFLGDPDLLLLAIDWSPDDRALAVIWSPKSSGKLEPMLEIVPVDGSGAVTLMRDQRLFLLGGAASVAWLDAGRLAIGLSHSSEEEPGTNLVVLPIDGPFHLAGEATQVHDFPGESVVTSAYDPVARRLVFATSSMQQDVFTAALQDDGRRLGKVERLTLDDRNDRPTGWLPDGRVLFMSDRMGSWDAFAQRPGSEPDTLFSGPAWNTWPTTADGGAVLAFQLDPTSRQGKCPVLRREPSGDLRPLFEARCETQFAVVGRPPPLTATMACLHRTAERCLLREPAEGHLLLTPFDARTGETIGVPIDTGIPAGEAGEWAISPDDREIAIVQNATQIVLVPTSGQGTTARLDAHLKQAQYPSWARDGAALFVAGMEFEQQLFALVRVERSGRVDLLLSSETSWISQPHVSPDGKTLAFGMGTYDTDLGCLEGL